MPNLTIPDFATQRAARDDLRALLAPATDDELRAILSALEGGRMHGDWYYGPCACLVGSITNHRWATLHPEDPEPPFDPANEGDFSAALRAYRASEGAEKRYVELSYATEAELGARTGRPAEQFAMPLRPGHTSANDPRAALLHEWISELLAQRGRA